MLITYRLTESHKIPPFCLEIPSRMPFVAVILWNFIKPPLPAPSEAPSAKPAVCFQWACATHFKFDPQSPDLSVSRTEAAHSHWMSRAHLTGFMNKCCLLPGESLLTVPTSVLSITTSPLSFIFSPHSSFTLLSVSHIHCLSVSHKSETSLPVFLSCSENTQTFES